MEGVRLNFSWKSQLYLGRIKIKQADITCFLSFNWQRNPWVSVFRWSIQQELPSTRDCYSPWHCILMLLTLAKLPISFLNPFSPCSLPLSSSLLVLSPHSLLLEAHRLRKIDPSRPPPPPVTRVRPSDLLLYLWVLSLDRPRSPRLESVALNGSATLTSLPGRIEEREVGSCGSFFSLTYLPASTCRRGRECSPSLTTLLSSAPSPISTTQLSCIWLPSSLNFTIIPKTWDQGRSLEMGGWGWEGEAGRAC